MSQQVEARSVAGRDVPEEDVLRARFYAILAHLLSEPPSADTLEFLRSLEGDDTDMGQAMKAVATVAGKTSLETVQDEFAGLFIGVVKGELMPYASYYLTGFLQEKPLAVLRGDMERLGIARADSLSEPEDHIGVLFEMMQGLILGSFGKPADVATQKEFFEAHILQWAPRFFGDLEKARSAVLYMPVGTMGRVFMEIEAQAFTMTA